MSRGGGKDAKVGSQATALKKTRTLFQNLQGWPSSLDTIWPTVVTVVIIGLSEHRVSHQQWDLPKTWYGTNNRAARS